VTLTPIARDSACARNEAGAGKPSNVSTCSTALALSNTGLAPRPNKRVHHENLMCYVKFYRPYQPVGCWFSARRSFRARWGLYADRERESASWIAVGRPWREQLTIGRSRP
jgi:hypothetical protein